MPILNYTTKVDVYSTVGTIQGILVKHGARRIVQDYDESGHIKALCFSIMTPFGERAVRLPSDSYAVQRVLERQKVNASPEQAERVAWRILKDWIEAQMAILESEMVSMEEIFLPYMVTNNGGQTVFERYVSNQLMLEERNGEDE